MDGRVQLPVIRHMQKRFEVDYVDVVSEAGPNLILATRTKIELVESILARVDISVSRHGSVGIAVVGHHDCAGNPGSKSEQEAQIRDALAVIRQRYGGVPSVGLWVDETWEVSELG